MEFILLVLVAAASFEAGRLSVTKFSSKRPEVVAKVEPVIKKASSSRTEERKGKIIQLIKETVATQTDLEECSGMITPKGIVRGDVEHLLDVSSATARRYLNLLVAEDTIVQIGQAGKEDLYVLKMD